MWIFLSQLLDSFSFIFIEAPDVFQNFPSENLFASLSGVAEGFIIEEYSFEDSPCAEKTWQVKVDHNIRLGKSHF